MNNWVDMYDDPYAVARVKKACELLKRYCPSGTVVEVGAFQNLSWNYLKGHDYSYYPYDFEKYTDWTNIVDLEHLFTLIPADAILCLEVLEHIKNPHEVLNCLCRFVKQKGILVISLPNEVTAFHRLRALAGIVDGACFERSPFKHLHLPSLSQSRAFLEQSGKIIDFWPYINSSAKGSRQATWVGPLIRLLPDWVWQALAHWLPSLFARGWIFVLKPHQNALVSDCKPAASSPNS